MTVILLFNYNNQFKERFVNEPAKYYKDNHHKAHFLTAIEIFKDNKITGSGIKTFRVACHNKKMKTLTVFIIRTDVPLILIIYI